MALVGPAGHLQAGVDLEGGLALEVQPVAQLQPDLANGDGCEEVAQVGAHKTPGKDVRSLASDG